MRRDFLKACGLAGLGVALPILRAEEQPKEKDEPPYVGPFYVVFNAAGGLHSYGIGATAILPLGKDNPWTAVLVAGYDRLTGDAADNPLVQLRGSEDQASLGVFLSYTAF